MSDWIDSLSDHEHEQEKRKGRVAEANNTIFNSLWKALESRVERYNERHPPRDIGRPNAVWINPGPYHSTLLSVKIQKNAEPRSSLSLEFPINEGAMRFQLSSEAGGNSGTIEIDIENGSPTFQVAGNLYSVDSLADMLLRPVLDPWAVLQKDSVDRLSQAERADAALQRAGKETAASELREAAADLSKEPPDLTGAVQHSLAALECVARERCGDHATFGKLVERYPDLFPKPLDKGIEKIWGFASEMGRHLQEGRTPKKEEAELLVGLATAWCTYLARKIEGEDVGD